MRIKRDKDEGGGGERGGSSENFWAKLRYSSLPTNSLFVIYSSNYIKFKEYTTQAPGAWNLHISWISSKWFASTRRISSQSVNFVLCARNPQHQISWIKTCRPNGREKQIAPSSCNSVPYGKHDIGFIP